VFIVALAILLPSGYRAYKFMMKDKKKEVSLVKSLKLIANFFVRLETEAMGVPHKRDRILEHVLILVGLGLYILLAILYLLFPRFFEFKIISKAVIYIAALSLCSSA